MHVHPSAFVDEGAEIGTGTRIWHHVHVRAGSRIGSGCVLGKNVYVDAGVVIGNRCKIQNNMNIYQVVGRCGRMAPRGLPPSNSFDCPTCRGEEHQE